MVTIDDVWVAKQMYKRIIHDNAALENYQCDYLPAAIWQIVCGYTCEDPDIVNFILRNPWGHQDGGGYETPVFTNDGDNAYLEVREIQTYKGEHALVLTYPFAKWGSIVCIGYELYEHLLILPMTKLDGTETSCANVNKAIVDLREIIYKLYKSDCGNWRR